MHYFLLVSLHLSVPLCCCIWFHTWKWQSIWDIQRETLNILDIPIFKKCDIYYVIVWLIE